ncbi:MAG: hypothetical protein E6Q97_25860 [Desulfurellales bacterium]|nr:MAG: hypothetical protein E6Q97_25860 [Desulfurellales bacterium]
MDIAEHVVAIKRLAGKLEELSADVSGRNDVELVAAFTSVRYHALAGELIAHDALFKRMARGGSK